MHILHFYLGQQSVLLHSYPTEKKSGDHSKKSENHSKKAKKKSSTGKQMTKSGRSIGYFFFFNFAIFRRLQFCYLQKTSIQPFLEDSNFTIFRRPQYCYLQKTSILLSSEDNKFAIFKRQQFCDLQKTPILLSSEDSIPPPKKKKNTRKSNDFSSLASLTLLHLIFFSKNGRGKISKWVISSRSGPQSICFLA